MDIRPSRLMRGLAFMLPALASVFILTATPAGASSTDPMVSDVFLGPTRQTTQQTPPPASKPSETVTPIGGEAVVAPQLPTLATPTDSTLAPFGSQLFTSQSAIIQPRGVNPNYIIAPGDQVSVQIWGAQSYSGTQVVDPQGNIFLPEIGPVPVGGQTVARINASVNNAVQQVFTANVNAYVNVLSRQPVGVYVTGSVRSPGRYSGERSASPLNFLAQAGGIDPRGGSFRDIRIMRNNTVLASMDLYEFLLMGKMPPVMFEDNDTIFVGPQGATVSARGEVQNSYRFEVAVDQVTGADIIALARPEPSVSHVSIKGVRADQPYNAYLTMAEFAGARVRDGDEFSFVTDRVNETIFVSVTGQSAGPSSFAVARGARLGDVLKLIEVDPTMADLDAIHLRRVSVALQQQRAIEMSLNELQRAVLTGTTTTGTEAEMRAQEAKMVEQFVTQARSVKPEGRVVLADNPNRNNLTLEPDDVIIIPNKSQVVTIAGEVRMPQTLLWKQGMSIGEYVDAAGGYTDRADDKFVVIHRSGAAEVGSHMDIQAGDQIMVMPLAGEKGFAVFHDTIDVLYRVAVSSGVLLNASRK